MVNWEIWEGVGIGEEREEMKNRMKREIKEATDPEFSTSACLAVVSVHIISASVELREELIRR